MCVPYFKVINGGAIGRSEDTIVVRNHHLENMNVCLSVFQ